MTTPSRRGEPVHAFTGIGDQNQLNPMFAREGEATDFPLNTLPSAELRLVSMGAFQGCS